MPKITNFNSLLHAVVDKIGLDTEEEIAVAHGLVDTKFPADEATATVNTTEAPATSGENAAVNS